MLLTADIVSLHLGLRVLSLNSPVLVLRYRSPMPSYRLFDLTKN